MELEFDKEIDAILRKGAREPAAAGSLKSAHLEADAIAAFAENALPATARSFYVNHLADCDRCRNILAQTISLHDEADMQAASSAIATGVATEVRIPWYRKLSAIPNLAASMGMLIVVFVGLFGYILYQRNAESRSSDVAKLNQSEPAMNKAAASEPAAPFASNAASNSADTTANTATPTVTSGGSPMTKQIGQEDQLTDVAKNDTGYADKAPEAEKPASEVAPTGSAPMQPLQKEQTKAELDEKKVTASENQVARTEPQSMSEERKINTDLLRSKDAPATGSSVGAATNAPAKKMKAGPYRDLNNNNRGADDKDAELAANGKKREDGGSSANARRVAGKSFQKKNGVWYDTSYQGQPTIDIGRGTGQYRTLDAGLRNLADSISGTLVVVWKGRAYRIQ